MEKELTATGNDVVFVGAHGYTADSLEEQKEIHSQMSYALLQERRDASFRDTWGRQDRHDIYVFGPDGKLLEQIHGTTTAGSVAGYDKLKAQLLAHLPTKP